MVSSLRRHALILAWLLVPAAAAASPLFEDDTILDVQLSGPLTSVIRGARHQKQLPFTISAEGATTDVRVRVRGKSRVKLCRFPPLRLNFSKTDSVAPLFDGLGKVKLVTHCNSGKQASGANVLNEYLAYRIFNLLTDRSYRVRLLRVTYVDTDGKMGKLDRQFYGYLIEPTRHLTERTGGNKLEVEGVQYSRLEAHKTALLYVFQYLIGNSDWSLVTAEDEDHCCHNIDLIQTGTEWALVPYDFDLAGLVDAKYRSNFDVNQTRRRVYSGYCKTPIEQMAMALAEFGELEDKIIRLARQVPSADEESSRRRLEYLEGFFSANESELLQVFDKHCLGRR